jgi:hypothetical protein
MSKDTRTPVSVTQVGRVTVKIYDEAAYRAHLAHYYPGEEATRVAAPRRSTSRVYEKHKPAGRYNWTGRKPIPYERESISSWK